MAFKYACADSPGREDSQADTETEVPLSLGNTGSIKGMLLGKDGLAGQAGLREAWAFRTVAQSPERYREALVGVCTKWCLASEYMEWRKVYVLQTLLVGRKN